MGFIELGFLDDGITIPGSFNKHGRHYDEKDHYKAIDAAIRGKSTKAGRERGFGLSSNVEMFRDLGKSWLFQGMEQYMWTVRILLTIVSRLITKWMALLSAYVWRTYPES